MKDTCRTLTTPRSTTRRSKVMMTFICFITIFTKLRISRNSKRLPKQTRKVISRITRRTKNGRNVSAFLRMPAR
ncbi:hypothetical protein FisN_8Hu359 [Fistulifera solaris]|uniref:Uncharacterized protein n=1 Tax=Fistulifera solaris TaxID=1519565 RepID=A0A1Z5KI25_FISSO|nr:hypothetical protein FisN_8Hu359 [Fistulifera solaris]|eukprot:GAX25742.1 hypothetical protein FisN_8Hu359 [Fistulifera solaris]